MRKFVNFIILLLFITSPIGNVRAEIKKLPNFTHDQDPISLAMGYKPISGNEMAYHVGISSITSGNINSIGKSSAHFDDAILGWVQTPRLYGFAGGASITAAVVSQQTGANNKFHSSFDIKPTQYYLDYEYQQRFKFTGGAIVLNTPWMNFYSSYPGATYANTINSYRGFKGHLQINENLFLTALRTFSYQQYPNYYFYKTNLYNTYGGPLANLPSDTTTSGAFAVGGNWHSSQNHGIELWYYKFYDYADLWYLNSNYHLPITSDVSMSFGLQVMTENISGSGLASSVTLPGSNVQAGRIKANAFGFQWQTMMSDNTLTVAYNNVLKNNSAFLKGGMITPYTYGLETDPLYTTASLSSIAEMGSGQAFLIDDTQSFLASSLKFSLRFAHYTVNQAYSSQANKTSELDVLLQYTVPNTTLNIWSRLVYINQPQAAGGSYLQPRLIVNWTF